jgi:hypothetical protein
MYKAECRARLEGKLLDDDATPITSAELDQMEPPEGVTPRAINAVFPIAFLLIGILTGLYFTGQSNLINRPADQLFEEKMLHQSQLIKKELFIDHVVSSLNIETDKSKDTKNKRAAEIANLVYDKSLAAGYNQQIIFNTLIAKHGSKKLASLQSSDSLGKELTRIFGQINATENKLTKKQEDDVANKTILSIINKKEAGELYHQANFTHFLGIRDILGASSSFDVLLWISFGASVFAIILYLFQGILTVEQCFAAWFEGGKSMAMAIMVLTLAWSLGTICDDMKTAEYVSSVISGVLSPNLLPLMTFITACFIAFATGSSWATMTILIPIVVKVSLDLSPTPDGTEELLVGSIAAVLSGAIFGDHCSPISDTTIMSSLSAGCDHIHHVWSQIPYALTTGIIAALVGYLPAGYGYKWPELYLFAIFLMFLVLFSLGKPVPPAIPKEERVHLS